MITTPSVLTPVMIPPRTSLRTTDHRRRSLPAPSDAPPTRCSANHVNVKPASPAVISSLISTLSAISPPIRSRLEDLPRNYASDSTLSLPHLDQAEPLIIAHGGNVYQSDPPSPTRMGLGMDYEAYQTPRHLKENTHQRPSDAAGAPTIHKSPRWSPSDDILRSRPSRAEKENEHGIDETSPIGSLSIEPGPMASSTSIASTGSVGRKSPRSFKGLKFGASREETRKATENLGVNNISFVKQDGAETGSHNAAVDESRFRCLDSPMIFESTVEKDFRPESQRLPSRASSLRITAFKGGFDLHFDEMKVSQGSLRSPRNIPTRDSSLRRSHGGSSSQRKRRSYWSDQSGTQDFEKLSFESSRETLSQPPSRSVFDEIAEDDVSRRIKELKDQKKLRDSPLTIATTQKLTKATRTLELSRTPSPLPPVEVLLAEALDDLQSSRPNEIEKPEKDEAAEVSAPSPAIMQRINRNKIPRVSSMSSKVTTNPFTLVKHNTEQKAATTPLPQRSNSRLLRRLSRPSSPANPEKHKRTLSNSLVDERPKSIDSIDNAVDDYISSPRLSQKITHPQTRRIISFSEVGDPNGSVVFCCVGMGLTRYITAFYDELALTLKLRLITPDRPGVGGSEAHANDSDTPLGWPGTSSPAVFCFLAC